MSGDELARAERALAGGEVETVRALFGGVDLAAIPEAQRFRWWLVLVEAGHEDLAAAARGSLAGSAFQSRTEAVAGEPMATEDQPEADDLLEPVLADPREERGGGKEAELFLRWFGGRRDVYARQWYDERRRRSGYRPVEEPLTAEVVLAHLTGRLTAGQYLLYPDATVSFSVLDLDLEGGALENLRAAYGPEASATLHPGLRSFALRLLESGARLGLPLFLEDSGGRGLHLWLFLEPRRPARSARALLGTVVLGAGPQPPEIRVELFPKQDRPGQKGLSSLVKLPLGVHQATLRRCPLLDDSFEPIEDVRKSLERLRGPAPDVVADVLGHRVMPLPPPELEPSEGPPMLPRQETARSLAEVLRAIEPGPPEREACERMLAGCAVLRGLVRRAYEQRRLAPAEARALLYTVGLVGPSCRLIEEVFATAQVSKKELERVRRGLPAPTGCNKLQVLDAEGARACRCPTGADAQPYATPALFAVGAVHAAPPAWKPFAPWIEEEPLEPADPLQTIAEWLRRIEERLRRLEGTKEEA